MVMLPEQSAFVQDLLKVLGLEDARVKELHLHFVVGECITMDVTTAINEPNESLSKKYRLIAEEVIESEPDAVVSFGAFPYMEVNSFTGAIPCAPDGEISLHTLSIRNAFVKETKHRFLKLRRTIKRGLRNIRSGRGNS